MSADIKKEIDSGDYVEYVELTKDMGKEAESTAELLDEETEAIKEVSEETKKYNAAQAKLLNKDLSSWEEYIRTKSAGESLFQNTSTEMTIKGLNQRKGEIRKFSTFLKEEYNKEVEATEKKELDKYEKTKLYSGYILSIANDIASIQLNKIGTQYDKEKELLDSKFENGIISRDEYDQKLLNLDNKRAKEEKKAKKQAKAWAITEIGINTWVEASKALAKPWLMALIIAAGAAAVAKVATAKYKYGGVLIGPSHESGGIKAGNVELEGGEGVINKTAMSNPYVAQAASLLNQSAGGGVPFSGTKSYMATGGVVNSSIGSDSAVLQRLDSINRNIAGLELQVNINQSIQSDMQKVTNEITKIRNQMKASGVNLDSL